MSRVLKAEVEFAEKAQGRHFRATVPGHVKPEDWPTAVTLKTNRGGRRGVEYVFAFAEEHERSRLLIRVPGARVL